MGTFTHPLTIRNPETGASVTVEALVDTGATFTVLPASLLRGLAIRPVRNVRMMLADGSVREVQAGRAEMTVAGKTEVSPCIFGAEDSPALLGAVTLESLLLAVDPVHRALVPTDGYLM